MGDDAIDGGEGRSSGVIQWPEDVNPSAGPTTLEEFRDLPEAKPRLEY